MFRFLVVMAAVLVMPAVSYGGECYALAEGILAMYVGPPPAPKPAPAPTPKPTPSGACDECNGTGKLGDSVVGVTCPICKGTGKKVTAAPPAAAAPPVPRSVAPAMSPRPSDPRRGMLPRFRR